MRHSAALFRCQGNGTNTPEAEMTTIGQVTTNGKWHLNLHGLAACGAGTGRIIRATITTATDLKAHGATCKRCLPGLRRDVTLTEATQALPKRGGYRISSTRTGLLVLAGFGCGWNHTATTPWDAMRLARQHRGQVVRAERAAKAERARRAATTAAVAHLHCRNCGGRLSDFDLHASPVEGLHFDCA
jgi:hypothetical protein